jgi:hypothetical protein
MDRNTGAAFDLGTGTDGDYAPPNTSSTDEPGAPSQHGNKPKMGDKVKGQPQKFLQQSDTNLVDFTGGAEKLAGSVTRNPGLKERGEEHKVGAFMLFFRLRLLMLNSTASRKADIQSAAVTTKND